MSAIPPDDLERRFKALGRGFSVTRGSFEIAAPCEVSDLDWNQLDQEHRPCMHATYREALRLAVVPDGQMSVTVLRIFGIPFLVPVSDARVSPSVYYQSYSIFSLIYVHTVIRSLPGRLTSDWYIVSHPLLKPLHFLVDRKIRRMNAEQNAEDVPIRARRADLRRRGYRFAHDAPDFVTANLKTENVVFPKIEQAVSFDLAGLKPGAAAALSRGQVELVVRPDGGGAFSVWNGVCPHEGGPLAEGEVRGDAIRCRWHGLSFKCAKVGASAPKAQVPGLAVRLETGGTLKAGPPA